MKYLVLALVLGGCASVPVPEPHTVLHDAIQLGACQEMGRAAKAAGKDGWAAYDNCVKEHGLR